MKSVTATWLLILPLCCAEPALAQAAFVQGGIVTDVRQFSGQPGDSVFDGNVATGMLGGGGFLTSMISASVEVDIGAESEVAQSVSVTIAARPATVTTTYASRRGAVSALFGIHSTSWHSVRVGAYAGLAFTAFRQRIAADAPAIVLTTPPPPTEYTHLAAAPTVGVDVAVAISRGFAVVGVVRAQGLEFGNDLRGFSVRPGAALRWSF